MKSISLKLKEDLAHEVDAILRELSISRNKYINEAVAFYNQEMKRRRIAAQLEKEIALIRQDSEEVLQEFEALPLNIEPYE